MCGRDTARPSPATSRRLGVMRRRDHMAVDHLAQLDTAELERQVKALYGRVARHPQAEFHFPVGRALAERLGYPADLLDRVPADALASFAGVGYHLDLAELTAGTRVLDLGSGSGTDSFAAARLVGPTGHVTGIDMTDEQLAKAERLRAGCAAPRRAAGS